MEKKIEKDCIHCNWFAAGKSPDAKIVGVCELFGGDLTYEHAIQGCSSWEESQDTEEIKIQPPGITASQKINISVNITMTLKNQKKVIIRTGSDKDREKAWKVLASQPRVFYRYVHGITRSMIDKWLPTDRIDITKSYPINVFTLKEDGSEDEFVGNIMILFHSPLSHQGHVARFEMGVIPSYQHYGIGNTLLEEAIRVCREMGTIKRIQTQIVCENQAAVIMYLKAGFQVEAVRRKAWFDEDHYFDCYIMVFFLD